MELTPTQQIFAERQLQYKLHHKTMTWYYIRVDSGENMLQRS